MQQYQMDVRISQNSLFLNITKQVAVVILTLVHYKHFASNLF